MTLKVLTSNGEPFYWLAAKDAFRKRSAPRAPGLKQFSSSDVPAKEISVSQLGAELK